MHTGSIIEVFKTNVSDHGVAALLVQDLTARFPGSRINFDLHDCDNILRVEAECCIPSDVAAILHARGFACEALD